VADIVEAPEVVARPVTRQATAAVAEVKADADSEVTRVRTVRPSAATLITPPAPKVDWEDRQARKRKKNREKTEAHATVSDTRQDTYLQSALYTFASLATAPVSVLVTLTQFRAMDTSSAFYDYLDFFGELTNGAIVRYRWSDTHTEHFHTVSGVKPAWIGDGLDKAQQDLLDDIRSKAMASESSEPEGETEAEPDDPAPADARKQKKAKRVKATAADVATPAPAPRVSAKPYQESKARSQRTAVSGR